MSDPCLTRDPLVEDLFAYLLKEVDLGISCEKEVGEGVREIKRVSVKNHKELYQKGEGLVPQTEGRWDG